MSITTGPRWRGGRSVMLHQRDTFHICYFKFLCPCWDLIRCVTCPPVWEKGDFLDVRSLPSISYVAHRLSFPFNITLSSVASGWVLYYWWLAVIICDEDVHSRDFCLCIYSESELRFFHLVKWIWSYLIRYLSILDHFVFFNWALVYEMPTVCINLGLLRSCILMKS